ncbi:MAG: citrate lyase acyl carrier protein [Eubacteriales bacterium]|nr:citrate lyase acyl carrier protein [Eubacteriales bacterium]
MEVRRAVTCGTHASSDVFIDLRPAEELIIELDSPLIQQYGEHIEKIIKEILQAKGIDRGHLRVLDHGALDCTIKARLETAIERSADDGL